RHQPDDELDLIRVAAGACGGVPERGALGARVVDREACADDGAGEAAGQMECVRAASSVEDDRLALLRRRNVQRATRGDILPAALDRCDLLCPGELSGRLVMHPGVEPPTPPQFLNQLDGLVCPGIALRAGRKSPAVVRG